MSDGFHRFTLLDTTHGEVKVVVAIPHGDDPWGVLAPLRGTVWGDYIRVVSGEAMSHARHGFSTPLMREIGSPPLALARKIADKDCMCALFLDKSCMGATRNCRPGPKLPDCYEPPHLADPNAREMATVVSLAWKDNAYVLVVVGPEFSLV